MTIWNDAFTATITERDSEWIELNTAEAVDSVVGKTVELRAPACGSYRAHPTHGQTVTVLRRDGGYLYIEHQGTRTGFSWTLRECVKARPL